MCRSALAKRAGLHGTGLLAAILSLLGGCVDEPPAVDVAATPADVRASAAQPGNPDGGAVVARRADGLQQIRLGPSAMHHLVMTRDENGTFQPSCTHRGASTEEQSEQ